MVVTPRYNRGMANREVPPVLRLVVGSIAYLSIVIVAIWMLGSEAWSLFVVVGLVVVAAVGPFVGAGAVWLIVRRSNRRDDPQRVPHRIE